MNGETYKIPLFSVVTLVPAAFFFVGAAMLYRAPAAAAVVAGSAILFWLLGAFIGRWTVRSEGLRLYFVNYMRWSDITGARLTMFMRLPHLRISRAKGMDWWLPLYFRGAMLPTAALCLYAPADSPIQAALGPRGHT